jgi:N-acylneuraminate cytidylyltransferase
MRSEKTAGDYATTADVILEVLAEYEQRGKHFGYTACIYPTAPFVTPDKLKEAYALLREQDAVMTMPVVAFSYPPQRGYIQTQGRLQMKWKENFNKRSQDLETMYHDAGQFYFYRTEQYKEQGGQIMDGIVPLIVDEMEVQDIDNESDWKLAELKYQMMEK